jgi:Dyp-type peroxidase family
MVTREIQDGIILERGENPRSHFKALFLDYDRARITLAEVDFALSSLWAMWDGLRKGLVPDLPGDYPVDPERLQVMLGFGQRLYDDFENEVTRRPNGISDRWRFLSPDARDDRSVLPGSGLRYAPEVLHNSADAPIFVQFTADSELAVQRAHRETLRLLEDISTRGGKLYIGATASGFGRIDKRSWITFHDGISNIPKGDLRREVVGIKPENASDQDWSLNGTYCVFMKISVDLENWKLLDQRQQEMLVGRTMFSGCPIIAIDGNGAPVTDPRCPVSGTREVVERGNELFREPPDAVPAIIKLSHVQRANHHREPFFRVDSRRIYRQGFEYLDEYGGRIDVGLNFISFQDDPDRTFFILTQPGWLGNVNFGGDPSTNSEWEANLLSVQMAGNYFVPPSTSGESFPGSSMFEQLIA